MTRRPRDEQPVHQDERPGSVPAVTDEEVAAVLEDWQLPLQGASPRESEVERAECESHEGGGGGNGALLEEVRASGWCEWKLRGVRVGV